jgi:hypothetical protein
LIATWLLRHLGSGPNRDAILGDISERYGQGQSRAWYWKQVLLAVVSSWDKSRLAGLSRPGNHNNRHDAGGAPDRAVQKPGKPWQIIHKAEERRSGSGFGPRLQKGGFESEPRIV